MEEITVKDFEEAIESIPTKSMKGGNSRKAAAQACFTLAQQMAQQGAGIVDRIPIDKLADDWKERQVRKGSRTADCYSFESGYRIGYKAAQGVGFTVEQRNEFAADFAGYCHGHWFDERAPEKTIYQLLDDYLKQIQSTK